MIEGGSCELDVCVRVAVAARASWLGRAMAVATVLSRLSLSTD